jgi:hypothetical protein
MGRLRFGWVGLSRLCPREGDEEASWAVLANLRPEVSLRDRTGLRLQSLTLQMHVVATGDIRPCRRPGAAGKLRQAQVRLWPGQLSKRSIDLQSLNGPPTPNKSFDSGTSRLTRKIASPSHKTPLNVNRSAPRGGLGSDKYGAYRV